MNTVHSSVGQFDDPSGQETGPETAAAERLRKNSRIPTALKRFLLSKKWLIVPPIVVGVFVMAYMVSSKKRLPRTDVPEQSIKAIIEVARAESIQSEVTGFGDAMPARTWSAIAEVSGRITWIHPNLESGNWIDVNEKLVEIDAKDYRLRLEQRNADLEQAEASLAELRTNQIAEQKTLQIEQDLLRVSKNDYTRMRRLGKQNVVSVSEVETAEGAYLRQARTVQSSKNRLSLYPSRIASAKAQIAMAKSMIVESERNMERTEIRSPMRGVLAGVDLEVGQVVMPNQTLFNVQDNQRIEIEAQISVSQLEQLLSQPASASDITHQLVAGLDQIDALVTSSNQSFQWMGKPLRFTESLDSETRTIGIVIAVENESNQNSQTTGSTPLSPGTYCEVHLRGRSQSAVITLPRSAFDGDLVYVVDDESRLRSRPIIRGQSVGERVVVVTGLAVGERVITRPPIPAIEGMLVRQK